MADVKTLQTRIALKYDSYAAWTDESVEGKGAKLVLLPGELGICYVGDTNQESNVVPTVLFKVGDGQKTFKELPWASAKAADVYSWAKASDVVYNQDAKTITFVGGNVDGSNKVITFNYVTLAEVQAITNGLDSRITALEGKFTGDGSVQGQIDALDGRLDTAEGKLDTLTGADTVDGSVAKALKDAKTYAEGQASGVKTYVDGDFKTAVEKYADDAASAAKSGAEATADAALTAYKSEMTAALAGKQDVIAENTYDVYGAAADVKTYVDGTFKTAIEGYADQAEADAKSYSDGKLATAVETINAKDLAQDTEIAKKLDASVYTAYINGKELSDAELKSYADGKASAAQSAAIAAAKTETETQISTLVTSGQVKINTDAIAQNKADIAAMDTAYKKAVSDEAKAREDADKAIDERLDAVEAFFATAEGETLDGALDTLKEIQDYLNGEGEATGGILSRVGQAETDIDNLEKEFNTDTGRVKVAEGKISALEARATDIEKDVDTKLAAETFTTWKTGHEDDHAGTATAITAEIAAAVLVEENARKAADKSITDAIGTSADGKDVATVYGAIADAKAAGTDAAAAASAVAGRMDTAEGEIDALQGASHTHANKTELDLIVSGDKAKWDDAYAKRHEHANKAELDLIATGDKAKWDTAATNAGNAVADLAALTGDNGRVKAAENAIDALELIVNDASKGNDKLRTDVNALQELTKADGVIRSEIADAKKAGTDAAAAVKALSEGQVTTNKNDINTLNGKVAAIEGDYLKKADLFIFNCGSATEVTHVAE